MELYSINGQSLKGTPTRDMLYEVRCSQLIVKFNEFVNKQETYGLHVHLSIRDSTLTSCQKGSYLHINSCIIE